MELEIANKQARYESGLFLKVASGGKAEVLSAAVHRAPVNGSILEIGAYCGYSATLIAILAGGNWTFQHFQAWLMWLM